MKRILFPAQVYFLALFPLIYIVSLFAEETGNIPFHKNTTIEEIQAILQKEHKNGFLYFTLKGCGPCKALEDSVFTNKLAVEYIESNFIPFWIESNNGAGNALFQKHNVRGTPTVILIGEEGEVINKVAGFVGGTPEKYLERLKAVANPDSSIGMLRKTYESNPDNLDAARLYADMLRASGERNEAAKIYEKLKDAISDPDIYVYLASCYESNDTQKAIDVLEQGLVNDVIRDEADVIYLRLGNLLTENAFPIEIRDYGKALKYYSLLPEKARDFSIFSRSKNDAAYIQFMFTRAQIRMPFAYIKSGEAGKGKEIIKDKFIKAFDKKDYSMLGSLLYACVLNDEYLNEASVWAEKAAAIPECKDYGVFLFSAMVLQKTSKFDKAAEIQEKAVALARERKIASIIQDAEQRLAAMYMQAGYEEKAWSLFNKLLSNAGNDFWIYFNLASECTRNDVIPEKALEWAEKSLELSKTEYAKESEGKRYLEFFPGMFYEPYAEALFKTGKIEKAIEVQNYAIKIALDEDSKRRFRVVLEKYKAASRK